MDDDAAVPYEADVPTGRTEQREERQHALQQHGETFAVDDDPADAGADEQSASNRVRALPGDEDGDASPPEQASRAAPGRPPSA